MRGTFPSTHSLGPNVRLVNVSAVTGDGLTAICTDRKGFEVRVPLYWQRAKGQLPQRGEDWLVSQDTGQWTFLLFLGSSASPYTQAAYTTLTLENGAAPATPSAGATLFGNQGAVNYVGADGNIYSTGRLTLVYTGTGQLVNSTSPATISGLSCPVAAGTYHFRGRVLWTQGSVQAQQAMRITGPATSAFQATLEAVELSTTGESVFVSSVTTIGSDLGAGEGASGQPNGANVSWRFDGHAVFTAPGTLAVVVRCVTSSADTYTVLPGSFVDVLS